MKTREKMDPECGQGVESDPAKGQWPLSNNTINSMTQQNLPGAVNNSLSLPNSVTKVSANYRIMVHVVEDTWHQIRKFSLSSRRNLVEISANTAPAASGMSVASRIPFQHVRHPNLVVIFVNPVTVVLGTSVSSLMLPQRRTTTKRLVKRLSFIA